tara:strand:- start:289 stop:528 length:240 start_codon:yes stop_codon:yes gene_type:complete
MNKFIRKIKQSHQGETVLAATHDSPIRIAASIALGLPDSEHKQDYLKAPLASMTILNISSDSIVLEAFRDISHLENTDG